jgi:autophagy-related protein 9
VFQAEDGKTELSLVHFTLTNPEWQPPTDAEEFVTALRTQARKDANQLLGTTGVGAINPLYSSLHSVSSLGAGVCLVPVCDAECACSFSVLSTIFNQNCVM